MTKKNIDCCFLVASNSSKSYQKLSKDYAAIEPPTWALLLAESVRSVGFNVNILDANAEGLKEDQISKRVLNLNPKLICFVVYGQNVNAGTTNMSGAVHIANYLKENKISIPIAFIGSHVQALPVETLKKEKSIDFVFTNEGVYALRNVLKLKSIQPDSLENIKGLAVRRNGKVFLKSTERTLMK